MVRPQPRSALMLVRCICIFIYYFLFVFVFLWFFVVIVVLFVCLCSVCLWLSLVCRSSFFPPFVFADAPFAGTTITRGASFTNVPTETMTYNAPAPVLNYDEHPFQFQASGSYNIKPYLQAIGSFYVGAIGTANATAQPYLQVSGQFDSSAADCQLPYSMVLGMDSVLTAQAQIGFSFLSWDSDVYSWPLPSLGPYQLQSGCITPAGSAAVDPAPAVAAAAVARASMSPLAGNEPSPTACTQNI